MFKSNGGVDSLRKRDRDEDNDEETGGKREKLSFEIPKPLFPPRKDIPPLPTIDIHNYTMLTTVIKIKQNMPFSIYNLNQKTSNIVDGIERYSNRFSKLNGINNSSNNNIELQLPGIQNGYFPYDLTVNKKKPKKKRIISTKTLDGLQKEEEEEGKEGEENEEEEEDEEEEVDGDYADDMGNDDDSDGGGDSDGGENENTF